MARWEHALNFALLTSLLIGVVWAILSPDKFASLVDWLSDLTR